MSRRQDGPPRQPRVFAALDAALAQDTPTTARQDTIAETVAVSGPVLAALADRVDAAVADATLAGATTVSLPLSVAQMLADLAAAARRHGYPRPALEALASEADRLPSARTADPSTSHDARPPQVRRGNMLARLLVGFLAYERHGAALVRQDGGSWDATLTSEELAKRLDLEHTEYAKRCSDLLALGYIRVARDADGHERTRRGDSGRQRLVFELTAAGREHATELARTAG